MNMISRLFEYDIGIDLGTANMRVWVKGEGLVLDEPTVVTVDESTRKILAVGEEAKRMLGSTPRNLIAIRPVRCGVIEDFDLAEKLIRWCIAKIDVRKLRRPRAVIAVPCDLQPRRKTELKYAALKAGVREVFMAEAPMAAAIGAGLPVTEVAGNMVVDIGAGTTEMALVSLAGIVAAKSIPVGGDAMNEAIIAHLREHHDLLVGERTAEDIKLRIGSAHELAHELEYEIEGRDVAKGRPHTVQFDSPEIRKALDGAFAPVKDALGGPLGQIEAAVRRLLEMAPPQIAADLTERGFVLTGGGALLPGLDKRLAEATGFPVRVADDPAHAVIRGVGRILDELRCLSKITPEQQEPTA